MAGTIIADTLTHSTAGSVTTDYVVNGSAKAWVNFNGTGTIAARDSLNLSGLTDNGTGDTTIAYSNAFANANHVLNYTTGYGASLNYSLTAPTTTSSRIQGYNTTNGSAQDRTYNLVNVHGDLA